MKYITLFASMLAGMAQAATEQFRLPDLQRKYNEVCWVVSHNAAFSRAHDYIYYNQNISIMDQYKAGARGFEFDIEKRSWGKGFGIFGSSGTAISLCHDSCTTNKWLQPKFSGLAEPTGDPMSFQEALRTVRDILNNNRYEILTLTLENRVENYNDVDNEFKEVGLQDMILKPSDWDPIANQGWPTLEWMITHNKRLVIFNDRGPQMQKYQSNYPFASTYFTYYQWPTIVQNRWGGAKDINLARLEREQSEKENLGNVRYLYEFDWFADGGKLIGGLTDLLSKAASIFNKETPFTGDPWQMNGQDLDYGLKTIVEQGLSTGRAKGRYPNFIKIDFVEEGNAVGIANRINDMANDPSARATMFAPIP